MNRLLTVLAAVLTVTAAAAGAERAEDALPSGKHVWLEDFRNVPEVGLKVGRLPESWRPEGMKLGVPETVALLQRIDRTQTVLRVTCNKSTGGIICDGKKSPRIDLKKYPVMRWRWRVVKYPDGADGRVKEKDDQPIAIYIGFNGFLTKRSLAYRWEGATPVGFEGTAKYGGGLVKVNFIVVRNQETPAGEWVTETRNLAEDFKRIYGEIPGEFALSIMANSQYTRSDSAAEIAFIEFLPAQ